MQSGTAPAEASLNVSGDQLKVLRSVASLVGGIASWSGSASSNRCGPNRPRDLWYSPVRAVKRDDAPRWRQRTTQTDHFPRGRHDFTISQVSDAIFFLAFCGEGFSPAIQQNRSHVVPLGPGSQADNVAALCSRTAAAALGQARIGG